jgi:hypothetical protein
MTYLHLDKGLFERASDSTLCSRLLQEEDIQNFLMLEYRKAKRGNRIDWPEFLLFFIAHK